MNGIFNQLGVDCSLEEFSKKFKEDYAEDWDRITQVYNQHERKDTKGKGHPMPEPNQYIKNMYTVGKSKYIAKKKEV